MSADHTLAQGVRALAEDLRRETTEWIAAGRGLPRYDGAWIAGRLEELLRQSAATGSNAAQVLRAAANDLDDLGRGCAPEYATWLRVRADRLERA